MDLRLRQWMMKPVENNIVTVNKWGFPVTPGTLQGWKRLPKHFWQNMAYYASRYMVLRPDGLHPAIDFWREKENESAGDYFAMAINDGIVVDIVYDKETYPDLSDGRDFEWGNLVLVQHDYIENNKKKQVWSLYAHLATIDVELGQKLKRGEFIGAIGQTDGVRNTSLWGPHLHFEIRKLPLKADAWPKSMGFTFWDRFYLKKEVYHHPIEFIENN